jgi:hypothetical protein
MDDKTAEPQRRWARWAGSITAIVMIIAVLGVFLVVSGRPNLLRLGPSGTASAPRLSGDSPPVGGALSSPTATSASPSASPGSPQGSLGPNSPTPRSQATMVYEPNLRKLLLIGGLDRSGRPIGDNWAWSGRDWSRLDSAISPSARIAPVAAFDEARNRLVLFGGAGGPGSDRETWTLEATGWAQLQPTSSPPPLSGRTALAAYDPIRQNLIVVGMPAASPAPPQVATMVTWVWDGRTWTERHPLTLPRPREAGALLYDPNSRSIMLIGGDGGQVGVGPVQLTDSWSWDGNDWRQLQPRTTHSGGVSYAAYDPVRNRVVLLTYDGKTWTWDGVNWSEQQPGQTPGGRLFSSAAFSPSNSAVILFGGRSRTATSPDPDTEMWAWDGSTWARVA